MATDNNAVQEEKLHHEHIAEKIEQFLVNNIRYILIAVASLFVLSFALVLFNVYREGQLERANVTLERGISSYMYVQYASGKEEAVEFLNDAIKSFRQVEKAAGSSTIGLRASFYTGASYYQMGDYNSAISYFKKVVKKRNSHLAPMAQLHIAWAYTEVGDFGKAMIELKRFEKLFDDSYLSSEAVITLSKIHNRLNDKKTAVSVLKKHLAKNPNDNYADIIEQRIMLLETDVY